MKTTHNLISTSGRDQFVAGASRHFPQFTSNYHAELRGSTFAVPHRAELRRFRRLSGDFLGKETSRDYLKELSLFAVLVAISAWPMLTMLRVMGELLK